MELLTTEAASNVICGRSAESESKKFLPVRLEAWGLPDAG